MFQNDENGRGLDFIFKDAGLSGRHGLPDSLRRDPSVPPENFDFLGGLDDPQDVDRRSDI